MFEAKLFRNDDVVIFCVLRDSAYNNMFHDFADHTGERNWMVVFGALLFSVFENRCHKCSPPASKNDVMSK